ncbi:MAG: hypothetical protein JNK75_10415 [Betaproteobacteria bacterium]|nr:hypothetical protein [Betaproteobacteria bacterium]
MTDPHENVAPPDDRKPRFMTYFAWSMSFLYLAFGVCVFLAGGVYLLVQSIDALWSGDFGFDNVVLLVAYAGLALRFALYWPEARDRMGRVVRGWRNRKSDPRPFYVEINRVNSGSSRTGNALARAFGFIFLLLFLLMIAVLTGLVGNR